MPPLMLDWDDLRVFLAIARKGSQVAAAQSLALSQPTIGRRLASLEARLGAKLFQVQGRRQKVTRAGEELLEAALRMEQELLGVERRITGRDAGMAGLVRITAPEWFGARVLSPVLASFLEQQPQLTVELVTDARRLNLVQREADIALRFTRFEQQEIVQRKVGKIEFGLFASKAYLSRKGRPDFAQRCSGHVLVTMSEELSALLDVAWLEEIAGAAHIAYRSNSRDAQALAAAADLGMVCLPKILAEAHSSLVPLEPPSPPPERELWLGVHREASKTPRIRALGSHIAKALLAMGR